MSTSSHRAVCRLGVVSLALFVVWTVTPARSESQSNLEPVAILRACGFVVRQYKFISNDDSSELSFIRITNPLFNAGERGLGTKLPVIYLHGTTISHVSALEHHQRIRPRDFSHLEVNKLSRDQLLQHVGSDPSARNFLFLALNFGHEVWFLARRGFEGSRQRVQDQNRTLTDAIKAIPESLLAFRFTGSPSLTGGLPWSRPRGELGMGPAGVTARVSAPFDASTWLATEMTRLVSRSTSIQEWAVALFSPLSLIGMPESSLLFLDERFRRQFIESFNPDFWNFSLDEQAKYDLPAAMDFVLEKTQRRQAHLVGFSAGGTVVLMGLAENPKLAEKIGAAVLWAPAVNLGSANDVVFQLSQMVPIFQSLVAPFPFTFLNRPLQMIAMQYCTSSNVTYKACRLLYDSIFGYSGEQAALGPIWWFNTFASSPSNELKHLGQMAHTKQTCKFNFNTPVRNLEVYGQPTAPCYDFSRITSSDLFFYGSLDDRLVSVDDIRTTLSQLSANYTFELISERGVHFNHLGYIVHDQNARLVVVPTLQNIASVEARGLGGAR